MKKIITTSMILASCAVNAGTMGPVTVAPTQAFISAEGGYTWNQIDGLSANFGTAGRIFTKQSTSGGTGRLAVGVMKPVYNAFYLTGEFGGGYYGSEDIKLRSTGTVSTNLERQDLGLRAKATIYGYDILAGLSYEQPAYGLFFKAGTMIQNLHGRFDAAGDARSMDITSASIGLNTTEALPEIKLGGSYHVYENLSITASWSHVFGSTLKGYINRDMSSLDRLTSGALTLRNPSLDVALVGLEYRFA